MRIKVNIIPAILLLCISLAILIRLSDLVELIELP